ncbi:hypothetical protein KY366_06795 [Candidatus Woesearchaeota archaeon]|nr:hypothetical protein [Candidatus Woesearchaeota archaeon]
MAKVKKVNYIQYIRESCSIGDGPKEGCIGFLLVPHELMNAPYNPMVYRGLINEIEICDYIDGQMVVSERNKEERKTIIQRSPRIMGLNKKGGDRKDITLYVKSDNPDTLRYYKHEGGIVEPLADEDYICKKSVLLKYLSKCLLEYPSNEREAISQKILSVIKPYKSIGTSHLETDATKLDTLQIFLLKEFNELLLENKRD